MTTETNKLVEMALSDACEKGWCAAAQWASRDDLRHDITSPAYLTQRDHDLAALATQAQGQDAAPAEQPQAVELLDERGEIRRDLKSSAYCVGNEYKPFHPSASHVRPEWRDGWNACFVAAIRAARAKE